MAGSSFAKAAPTCSSISTFLGSKLAPTGTRAATSSFVAWQSSRALAMSASKSWAARTRWASSSPAWPTAGNACSPWSLHVCLSAFPSCWEATWAMSTGSSCVASGQRACAASESAPSHWFAPPLEEACWAFFWRSAMSLAWMTARTPMWRRDDSTMFRTARPLPLSRVAPLHSPASILAFVQQPVDVLMTAFDQAFAPAIVTCTSPSCLSAMWLSSSQL
mmetsp:Transcript_38516/g.109861  ORF Transcript_38516/g.109861 Transcript_38516/m.109861 type:complete len:220 (-) Transcript_38516:1111-1770(-)